MTLSAAPLGLRRGDLGSGFDIARASMNLQAAEQLHAMLEIQSAERVLPLGVGALDAVLPSGGVLQGSVIELQVHGAGSAATSFALCVCRAAQQADGQQASSGRAWCAFIDPSASLFAPGVAQLGVELERLLVLRPDPDAIERVAIRIAEAKAVSVLVIDLRGALGVLPVSSQRWPRTIRRLALAVRHLGTSVLVITSAERRAALPLPVAMRLEFSRAGAESFAIGVAKERNGRVGPPHNIRWSVFDAAWPSPHDEAAWGQGRAGAA